ncbi:hypothetical protein ACTWPB_25275 [Nocardia sp. IBHARD005]|uniref:hypothetical protein n=1 Tax=Nocardia sp. IBHARD005 TaxID=3457765 RepID=UPI0040589595
MRDRVRFGEPATTVFIDVSPGTHRLYAPLNNQRTASFRPASRRGLRFVGGFHEPATTVVREFR